MDTPAQVTTLAVIRGRTAAVARPGPGRTGPDLRVLGAYLVNGMPVDATTAVELGTALTVAGGTMSRDAVRAGLQVPGGVDPSSPLVVHRARRLGIDVRYDEDRLRLACAPRIDALVLLELADAGRVREALRLYAGPCLPAAGGPFAEALRRRVDSRLTAAVLDSGDPLLVQDAVRRIGTWVPDEPATYGPVPDGGAVLGPSCARGCGLLPEI